MKTYRESGGIIASCILNLDTR